jgi:hypothetical protein
MPDECLFHADSGRGWRASINRIVDFIVRYNQSGNRLLCVGKGEDAWLMYKMFGQLERTKTGVLYDRICMVSIDMVGGPLIFKRNPVFTIPACVDRAWNVFQKNRFPRGAEVRYPNQGGRPNPNLHLAIYDVTHRNIVEQPSVVDEIKSAFLYTSKEPV